MAKEIEELAVRAWAGGCVQAWTAAKALGREEIILDLISLRFGPMTYAARKRVRTACKEGLAAVEEMLKASTLEEVLSACVRPATSPGTQGAQPEPRGVKAQPD